MLFDDFIVLDTRENPRSIPSSPASNPTGPAPDNKLLINKGVQTKESSYGEGTPMPYGPIQNPPPAPTSPSKTKVNAGQFVTPETIVAGVGLLGTFGSLLKKSDTQKTLKAVCGRKPIFNIGGKKDRYLACVDNYLNPKSQDQSSGMSSSSKTLVYALVMIFILIMIVVIVMVMKNRSKTA